MLASGKDAGAISFSCIAHQTGPGGELATITKRLLDEELRQYRTFERKQRPQAGVKEQQRTKRYPTDNTSINMRLAITGSETALVMCDYLLTNISDSPLLWYWPHNGLLQNGFQPWESILGWSGLRVEERRTAR